jgi:hypothetical protein
MRPYKFPMAMLLAIILPCCSSQSSDTIQSQSGLKCTVDLKRMCEENTTGHLVADGGVGLTEDSAMTEDNSPRTVSVRVPLVEGEHSVELWCDVNSRTRKVIYERIVSSDKTGAVSDAQIARLRINRYCSEEAAGP